ncbi:MAG: nucleoside deaminase [Hydrogenobaculum sp.]|nr:nucleoside deaminase [Hydrogenobaculum sp.]
MQIEYIEQKLIELCQEATSLDRVPVSAVVVKDEKIVSYAFNGIKSIEHAEMLALEKAMEKLNTKRLDGCALYVSLEPCPMCAYAIVLSRIEKVYFFSLDEKKGAVVSNVNILEYFDFKVKWEYKKNKVFEDILKDFFKSKRL